jgi:signal transduction histidine kinase
MGLNYFCFSKLNVLMSFKKFIRDLIIGKDEFIESHGEFKQVMLSGHIALISILICILYSVVAYFEGHTELIPIFFLAMIFLAFSIVCHRLGLHCRANCFLLPTINISVYLFASSEPSGTGTFMFFISTCIAAFAVFSYKQRILSILFAVFTYVLFVLAFFVDFSILPKRDYSQDLILFNIIVNFTGAFLAAIMAIYLMITLNHYNSLQLSSNNKLLSKTNAELDRFVYSTSHDLRAPLTSVMGLIDVTQRTDNQEEIKKYLGMMKGRLHSLDKFIKDITDYSRNNRLEVSREKVKLHDLAADIWESLKYTPEAQSINFKIDIPQELEIRSDKSRLSIVLSNLISNAVRYHDLRKEERFIKLRHQSNGKGFYIKVEDNGQGIPSEFHSKVFEMFFRGNENSQGSGLGLYIVKETMLKLSGTINLESAPGVGTTFTAKFPY